MSLIKCPKCGKKISDKADFCVHCGSALKGEEPLYCEECGTKINSGETVCSKCGFPIGEKNGDEPQKVEVVRIGKKISKTKIIIGIASLLLIVGIIVIIVVATNNSKSKQYKSDIKTISYKMLEGAATAEDCGNTIKSVWYNTIWKKSDTKTDKYTKKYGTFNSDFNDSLDTLFSSYEFTTVKNEVKSNQNEVNQMMKKMKNPPSEWEDAYDDLKSFYDNYLTLTNLCVNPTGSLQTYSNNFSKADNDTVNDYNKMKTYFD